MLALLNPVGALAEASEKTRADVAKHRAYVSAPEEEGDGSPLIENDPRAPLAGATKPELYNVMINSWEQCLAEGALTVPSTALFGLRRTCEAMVDYRRLSSVGGVGFA